MRERGRKREEKTKPKKPKVAAIDLVGKHLINNATDTKRIRSIGEGGNLMELGKLTVDSVSVYSTAFHNWALTTFAPIALYFCTALRPLTRSPLHSSKGHSGYSTEGPGALSQSPPLGDRRKQDPPFTQVHQGPAYPVTCGRGRANIATPQESRGAEVVISKATDEYSLSESSRRLHEPSELPITLSSGPPKGSKSACVRS